MDQNATGMVEELGRHRSLQGLWKYGVAIITCLAVLLVINQVFGISMRYGFTLLETKYLYLMIAIFLSLSYIIYPFRSRGKGKSAVPWYDIALFLLTIGISIFFAVKGANIQIEAWQYNAPVYATAMAIVFWILILEALRRCGGLVLFVVVIVFSLYPLFAPYMPTWISGQGYDLFSTANSHMFGTESVLGLPLKVFSQEIIGYIIFGVALQVTGGGKFFMDLALAMVGKTRGGPAKVAVLSSGFFGSISGSAISNVITTGSMTIPAMKRSGFPATVAGGVEACASTGGVLAPPVMGATAFIIAQFLQVPYFDVALAATVPAILYYFSLMIQVDFYAAKHDLRDPGVQRTALVSKVLGNGWIYVASILLMLYFLGVARVETWAPFYATAFLLIAANLKPATRMNGSAAVDFIYKTGTTLIELFVILASIGMIIGSLSMTGMAQAFSREITFLAGNNLYILLIFGAITCFILGMGMTVSAAYIFLAVVLIPALVQLDINPMSAHLFVMYWSMLSNITPPVALAAFAAAGIANSDPTKTGFQAMKLGTVIYFIPFFFVLNPVLIFQDFTLGAFSFVFAKSVAGIIFLAGALQGYIFWVGKIPKATIGYATRVLLGIGGFLIMIPEQLTDAAGMVALAVGIILCIVLMKRKGIGAEWEQSKVKG